MTTTTAPTKPTARKRRRRKSAPPALRLCKYLLRWAGKGGGCWKACPSYRELAKRLKISVDTVSRAFRALENAPDCPLAFASDYGGAGKTRRKLFALRAWLRHDGRPLLRRADGTARGTRASFRRGVRPYPQAGRTRSKRGEGNSDFRHAAFIKEKTSSADKPAAAPPPAGLSGKAPSANAAAWSAAREFLTDGEIFWHGGTVQMPLASLRTLIFPAFARGLDRQAIRRALLRAVRAAHDAARCAARPIQNPGAFAAAIFRDVLSLRPRRAPRPQPSGRLRTAPPPPAPRPAPRGTPAAAPSAEEIAARQQQALELAAMLRAALS